MIRRLRDLGMPLDDVRDHRDRPGPRGATGRSSSTCGAWSEQLDGHRQTVSSLRSLLEPPADVAGVERRDLPAALALAITDHVAAVDAVAWWMGAFTTPAPAGVLRAERAGADGALFAPEFFEDGEGVVTAFLPVGEVPGGVQLPARVRPPRCRPRGSR